MSEFKKKNDSELLKLLSEKRTALRNFRFSVSGGKVRNIKEGKLLRKGIAQILTEQVSRKTSSDK
jgi:ribosomal protein L29|tara:strand:+ start:1969 stop:2163 length:195 start_codon:yes stop_codon:yes gene_type:complete